MKQSEQPQMKIGRLNESTYYVEKEEIIIEVGSYADCIKYIRKNQ